MKNEHSRFCGLTKALRGKALRVMVATGALMLLISALPMVALQLSDVGLLTAPHARGQATGALSPKGDDLYIVRALTQRRQQTLGEEGAPYGEGTAIAMGYEGQMLMAGYLDEMQVADVLPGELVEPFSYEMEADGLYECTYQADTAGFLTFSLTNIDTGVELCVLTVESHTGKVVNMRLLFMDGLLTELKYTELLQAYCEYLGLNVLEDWAPCTDTYYGENAIYSKNGEALLAVSEMADDAAGLLYLMMDARVVPAEQYEKICTTYGSMENQNELSAAEGLCEVSWDRCLLDDTHYILAESTEFGCLLTVLDKNTMTNQLLCQKPGCTHAWGSGCPAQVDYPLAIFVQDGQVYALSGETQDDVDTMVLRVLEQQSTWKEIARILPEEYGISTFDLSVWYESKGILYGCFAPNIEGLESEGTILEIQLNTGEVQAMPVSAGMRVLDVWNGLFICGRTIMPAALGSLPETISNNAAAYSSAKAEVFLKSPITGEERKLTQLSGVNTSGWSMGAWAEDDNQLYCISGQYAADTSLLNLNMLYQIDLVTGTSNALYQIDSEEVLELNMLYDGKALRYSFAPDTEAAGQTWMKLSTQEITNVNLQHTMPYGASSGWNILFAWEDNFLVRNRVTLQDGIVWDGYALIPRQAFWSSDEQQAVSFDETPVLLARKALQNGSAFAEDWG